MFYLQEKIFLAKNLCFKTEAANTPKPSKWQILFFKNLETRKYYLDEPSRLSIKLSFAIYSRFYSKLTFF